MGSSMMNEVDYVGKRIGNFNIERFIAKGGFGRVYLGRHIIFKDDPPTAIKILSDEQASSEAKDQFIQEALLLRKLQHTYILSIIEAGLIRIDEKVELPYFVTKYAINGSLKERLRKGPLPLEEALNILSQVGQALQYAHEQEPAIAHRDLKPENILFDEKNKALLADFGIAILLNQAKTQSVSVIKGTLPYMAPEHFEGRVSVKSDQYALGCIAYELFTGQKPFAIPLDARADEVFAWYFQHSQVEPVPPTKLNPNLPEHIEQAILTAMMKQREQRHVDISAFLTALGASTSLPITPHPFQTIKLEQSSPPRLSSLAENNNISQKTLAEWLNEGKIHFRGERYEEALFALDQATHLDSNNVQAYRLIGKVLEKLKRPWEALAAYQQAIRLNPKFMDAYIFIGNIYLHNFNDYDKALDFYQQAIYLNPKFIDAYICIGDMYFNKHEYDKAFDYYQQATTINSISNKSMALIYLTMGDALFIVTH